MVIGVSHALVGEWRGLVPEGANSHLRLRATDYRGLLRQSVNTLEQRPWFLAGWNIPVIGARDSYPALW